MTVRALDAFVGLSSATGGVISGEAHLIQSLRDILTTPIGSRVMRRDYGSRLVALLGRPMTPGLKAEIVAAVAEAVTAWEPRIRLDRVEVAEWAIGRAVLTLIARTGRRYVVELGE